MSVRLSVRMEQLGSHWKDFHQMRYFNILRKSAEKIQDSLNLTILTVALHEALPAFMITSR
jgi:hypothetical protein